MKEEQTVRFDSIINSLPQKRIIRKNTHKNIKKQAILFTSPQYTYINRSLHNILHRQFVGLTNTLTQKCDTLKCICVLLPTTTPLQSTVTKISNPIKVKYFPTVRENMFIQHTPPLYNSTEIYAFELDHCNASNNMNSFSVLRRLPTENDGFLFHVNVFKRKWSEKMISN